MVAVSSREMSAVNDGAVVLLVEDEDGLRIALSRFLAREGFVVVEAATAQQAISALRASGPIDAVVADLGIPGSRDAALIAELKALTRGAPFVYMSGLSRVLAEQRHGLPPSAAFLEKPFVIQDLSLAVRGVLGPRTGAGTTPPGR